MQTGEEEELRVAEHDGAAVNLLRRRRNQPHDDVIEIRGAKSGLRELQIRRTAGAVELDRVEPERVVFPEASCVDQEAAVERRLRRLCRRTVMPERELITLAGQRRNALADAGQTIDLQRSNAADEIVDVRLQGSPLTGPAGKRPNLVGNRARDDGKTVKSTVENEIRPARAGAGILGDVAVLHRQDDRRDVDVDQRGRAGAATIAIDDGHRKTAQQLLRVGGPEDDVADECLIIRQRGVSREDQIARGREHIERYSIRNLHRGQQIAELSPHERNRHTLQMRVVDIGQDHVGVGDADGCAAARGGGEIGAVEDVVVVGVEIEHRRVVDIGDIEIHRRGVGQAGGILGSYR